jgi:hypothetical protein
MIHHFHGDNGGVGGMVKQHGQSIGETVLFAGQSEWIHIPGQYQELPGEKPKAHYLIFIAKFLFFLLGKRMLHICQGQELHRDEDW